MHFSFFTFFSDFVIFQVVKWMFLIFHDFQFSCHIPRPTVDISKFYFDCVEEVNEIWKGITFSGEDKDEGEHKGM